MLSIYLTCSLGCCDFQDLPPPLPDAVHAGNTEVHAGVHTDQVLDVVDDVTPVMDEETPAAASDPSSPEPSAEASS